MSLLSLASMLPHELLVKIFYNLEQRPQHRHSSTSSISFSSSLSLQRSDILVCALVCHDWYYAAVDTLWREVDLQSVESFIDFGRALDASFSYLRAEPSTAAYRRYSTNNWTKRGHDEKGDHDDNICPTDNDDHDHDAVQLHSHGSFSSLLSLTTSSKSMSANSPSASSSMAILRPSRRSARTGESPLSSSPGSLSSSSSSSSSSSTELSSLLCAPSPGPAGFAGRSYIRTLSLAGTSDCQGPRPFPYLPSCITDRHLFSMSTSMTHLTSILLNHCVALTDVSVIQLITLSSPYLQRIDLTECRLITNLTVQVVAQLCSQLEDLCLHSCGLITDEAIEELAYQCFRLKRIDLGKCSRISDRALLALLKNSGKSVHLNNEAKMAAQKARLTRIGVAGCRGVSFKGLMAITDHLAAPTSFSSSTTGGDLSSLVSLEFTCPAPIQPTPQWHPTTSKRVNPATRLFQALPSTLEEISVFDAYLLTHQDIVCLVDKTGSSLKSLKLDDAIAIQSETLSQILTCCPRLEVLAIPRASRLGNAGVVQFAEAKCAQSLVELDLSACSELTDECLIKLATRPLLTVPPTSTLLRDRKGKGVISAVEEDTEAEDCSLFPNLRRLDLSYNDKMTLTGIIPLVMSLKNLCALDVSFCGDGVTTAWSSSLEALRPILNPMSMTTEPEPLTESDSPQQEGREDDDALLDKMDEGTPDEVEVAGASALVQESLPHTAVTPSPPTSPSPQEILSPIYSPVRRGLGGYSGPRLQSMAPTIATAAENSTLEDSRRRDSASSISSISSCRSDASTSSTLTSLSSMSSESTRSSSTLFSCCSSTSGACVDTLTFATRQLATATLMHRRQSDFSSISHSHQQHLLHRRRRNSSLARIQLTARFDVLEVVPGRVGYSGAPHLDSWFTSQHQQELLQLFQIQVRQQRELQLQQQHQHQQQDQQQRRQSDASSSSPFFSASLFDPCGRHSRESEGCKDDAPDARRGCRLSVDEEAAAVLLELNEVLYLKTGVHPGDVNQNRGGGRWRPHPAGFHGPGAGGGAVGGGAGARIIGGVSLVRDYPGRHNSRRRSSLVAKGIVSLSGQCEISAWGLSLLKEEWAMV